MAQRGEGARVITLDKRQLLVRHCAGDSAAFPELVIAFNGEVYSYLVRSGVPQADRDDLFQEVFLSVHYAAKRYDPKLAIEPWLFTIVVNTVRDYFRKAKRRKEDSSSVLTPERIDPSPSPHQVSEAKDTALWLERELQTLPFDQREAILLSYVKDLSQEDVATALSLPLNTVKTHLRRGRLKLLEAHKVRNETVAKEAQS